MYSFATKEQIRSAARAISGKAKSSGEKGANKSLRQSSTQQLGGSVRAPARGTTTDFVGRRGDALINSKPQALSKNKVKGHGGTGVSNRVSRLAAPTNPREKSSQREIQRVAVADLVAVEWEQPKLRSPLAAQGKSSRDAVSGGLGPAMRSKGQAQGGGKSRSTASRAGGTSSPAKRSPSSRRARPATAGERTRARQVLRSMTSVTATCHAHSSPQADLTMRSRQPVDSTHKRVPIPRPGSALRPTRGASNQAAAAKRAASASQGGTFGPRSPALAELQWDADPR